MAEENREGQTGLEWEAKLTEFAQIRRKISSLAKVIPEEVRQEKKFGEWTMADMLAHISGWDVYTVKTIADWRNNKKPEWGGEVDDFNRRSVEARRGRKYEEIVTELDESGEELIECYRSLRLDEWDQPIWPEYPEFTPRRFLSDDLAHYGDEHLPQLLELTGEEEMSLNGMIGELSQQIYNLFHALASPNDEQAAAIKRQALKTRLHAVVHQDRGSIKKLTNPNEEKDDN